jgi:UDP-N-acetylglucosamine 2-epimerase
MRFVYSAIYIMKLVTVIGARPQFIKAAMVSRATRRFSEGASSGQLQEILVHTGQHYDDTMSKIFFEEMAIPVPRYNLEVGSDTHARQTANILMRLEKVLVNERPDMVLLYGDTNSTIAGSLAASKLNIPVAHVEAGLRSYNREMPEEINRILTDRVSSLLFCPTSTSVSILQQEGITEGVHLTGDVMFDASLYYASLAETRSDILTRLQISQQQYYLATVHRPANADVADHMRCILRALSQLPYPVVFPVHPRTRKMADAIFQEGTVAHDPSQLLCIDPVGYFDMLILEKYARLILTDSGGVQKEAYFFRVPCVTLRSETEWVETVELGWNQLCRIEECAIIEKAQNAAVGEWEPVFGDGTASDKIVDILQNFHQ